jgi:hypothetical protein
MNRISTLFLKIFWSDILTTEKVEEKKYEEVLNYLNDTYEAPESIVNQLIRYSQSTGYINTKSTSETELFLN